MTARLPETPGGLSIAGYNRCLCKIGRRSNKLRVTSATQSLSIGTCTLQFGSITMADQATILIVEDDPAITELMSYALENGGLATKPHR